MLLVRQVSGLPAGPFAERIKDKGIDRAKPFPVVFAWNASLRIIIVIVFIPLWGSGVTQLSSVGLQFVA